MEVEKPQPVDHSHAVLLRWFCMLGAEVDLQIGVLCVCDVAEEGDWTLTSFEIDLANDRCFL